MLGSELLQKAADDLNELLYVLQYLSFSVGQNELVRFFYLACSSSSQAELHGWSPFLTTVNWRHSDCLLLNVSACGWNIHTYIQKGERVEGGVLGLCLTCGRQFPPLPHPGWLLWGEGRVASASSLQQLFT